jgi:hypothetical protein
MRSGPIAAMTSGHRSPQAVPRRPMSGGSDDGLFLSELCAGNRAFFSGPPAPRATSDAYFARPAITAQQPYQASFATTRCHGPKWLPQAMSNRGLGSNEEVRLRLFRG